LTLLILLPMAVVGVLLHATGQAMAGPVLDFRGGSTSGGRPASGFTLGWAFDVSDPLTISGLGLFDMGADGLTASHQIGLWTSTGTLLVSTTIITADSTPVASASPVGNWRFTPIGSLTLDPGGYVVGATLAIDDPDQLQVNASGLSLITGVTFQGDRQNVGEGLNFPATFSRNPDPGFFGPNLFVGSLPAVTPEPFALLLLGSGLAGFVGLAWRRQSRS
jgi:hypothetical protein